jgi:hypothetical protein
VVEQIDQINVAVEIGALVSELHHHAAQLQILGLGYIGHQANKSERLLLRLGESSRLVERGVLKVLYPIISQMERAAGFGHDDTARAKLDKLDRVLAQGYTPSQDAALFAEMLSLPSDGRYPTLEMAPQQRRQKTLEALAAQLEALSRQKPILMIFEDAHWADPTSLEAFGRAVDRIRTLARRSCSAASRSAERANDRCPALPHNSAAFSICPASVQCRASSSGWFWAISANWSSRASAMRAWSAQFCQIGRWLSGH